MVDGDESNSCSGAEKELKKIVKGGEERERGPKLAAKVNCVCDFLLCMDGCWWWLPNRFSY